MIGPPLPVNEGVKVGRIEHSAPSLGTAPNGDVRNVTLPHVLAQGALAHAQGFGRFG
jgi:hypothetical protein